MGPHQVLAAAIIALCAALAAAHRGATTKGSCDKDFGSSGSALAILDPTISWSFSHYADCTNRAVWLKFTNPSKDFGFYVGVGVPPMPRFESLRVDGIIIGPGLPKLSDTDKARIPAEILKDPIMTDEMGAIFHRSPADQTTCAHLGTVMTKESTIRNGRCDFHEPYGDTHSWRVLDADANKIPEAGKEYYVAVWNQVHSSAKFGVAFGTWKEDFRSPHTIPAPTCTRNLDDFSEKADSKGTQKVSLPVKQCSGGSIGNQVAAPKTNCTLGQLCGGENMKACPTSTYKVSMGCGGKQCPVAAELWDKANMAMHMGMAINFTGDADVDFVRSMIPHHQGAVDMCDVLVKNLSCKTWGDVADLDGMVHFCNHVRKEQQYELAGMKQWLATKGPTPNMKQEAKCTAPQKDDHSDHSGHGGSGRLLMEKMEEGMKMSDGCGHVSTNSSKHFIDINRKMHTGMAVDLTCNHNVDFVRSMIPHHAGAVGMCKILEDNTAAKPDAYLAELCANITRLQYAEIMWMSSWLVNRKHSVLAPCKMCAKDQVPPKEPALPCEDMLPSTSFCHFLGGDLNCKCSALIKQYPCGKAHDISGFAVLNTTQECHRTCGKCPGLRPSLYGHYESACKKPEECVDDDAAVNKAAGAWGITKCRVDLCTGQYAQQMGPMCKKTCGTCSGMSGGTTGKEGGTTGQAGGTTGGGKPAVVTSKGKVEVRMTKEDATALTAKPEAKAAFASAIAKTVGVSADDVTILAVYVDGVKVASRRLSTYSTVRVDWEVKAMKAITATSFNADTLKTAIQDEAKAKAGVTVAITAAPTTTVEPAEGVPTISAASRSMRSTQGSMVMLLAAAFCL